MKLLTRIVLLSFFTLFFGSVKAQSSATEVKKKDVAETKSPGAISSDAVGGATKIAPKTETDTPIQVVTPPVETIENSVGKDEKAKAKKAAPKK